MKKRLSNCVRFSFQGFLSRGERWVIRKPKQKRPHLNSEQSARKWASWKEAPFSGNTPDTPGKGGLTRGVRPSYTAWTKLNQLNEERFFRRTRVPTPNSTVPSSTTLVGSGTAASAGMVPSNTAG